MNRRVESPFGGWWRYWSVARLQTVFDEPVACRQLMIGAIAHGEYQGLIGVGHGRGAESIENRSDHGAGRKGPQVPLERLNRRFDRAAAVPPIPVRDAFRADRGDSPMFSLEVAGVQHCFVPIRLPA